MNLADNKPLSHTCVFPSLPRYDLVDTTIVRNQRAIGHATTTLLLLLLQLLLLVQSRRTYYAILCKFSESRILWWCLHPTLVECCHFLRCWLGDLCSVFVFFCPAVVIISGFGIPRYPARPPPAPLFSFQLITANLFFCFLFSSCFLVLLFFLPWT